jgi:RNA polymerase sigma factor (sigma-70 family)
MKARTVTEPIVLVLEDDPDMRAGIEALLETVQLKVRAFASVRDFSRSVLPEGPSCLVCDLHMPDGNGLDLQDELRQHGSKLPIIFITAYGDISAAVRAMKAGATWFLSKPFREQALLDLINGALEHDRRRQETEATVRALKANVEALSPRQRSAFRMLADGLTTQEVCDRLALQASTVRQLRHEVKKKLGARTTRDLIRMGNLAFDRPVEGADVPGNADPKPMSGLSGQARATAGTR